MAAVQPKSLRSPKLREAAQVDPQAVGRRLFLAAKKREVPRAGAKRVAQGGSFGFCAKSRGS